MHPVVQKYSTVPMMALKDRKSFIKAIRTAKRVASGKRAAAACSACKKSRARCDDTRPCKRCRSLGICDGCAMQDLIDDTSISSVRVQTIESYPEPFKVELNVDQDPPCKPELMTYNSDANNQEILHGKFLPMFNVENFKPCGDIDLNLSALVNLTSSPLVPSFVANLANLPQQTFPSSPLGLRFPLSDLERKLSCGQQISLPTTSPAMFFNLSVLGATCNLQQQYQIEQQHQRQRQDLFYTQQQRLFNQSLSNYLHGPHVTSPLAPCSLPPICSAGRL
jgi:hypothetical protein